MRMPFKASPRRAAPLFLATVGLSLLALNCSSDPGTPIGTGGTSTTPTSGSAGMAAGGTTGGSVATGGTFTSGTTSGGTFTSGTTSGGSFTAGTATGGTGGTGGTTGGAGGTGGTGGTTGGASGAAGSSGSGGAGGSGGSGGGGGTSATFAAVKTLMAKTCGTGTCHNAASGELNYQDVANLYKTLTSPVPNNTKHCAGNPAVVKANDTNSLLLKALAAAGSMCMNNGNTQTIGRMPDGCPKQNEPCLTADQVKVFTDWVAAGAPM